MELKSIDLVFASEYFEHIENAIDHLIQILTICQPKYLIIANAFNATSLGHFNFYKHDNQLVPKSKMNVLFASTMKEHGYEKMKTKFWNDRPAYWKKI